MKSNHSFFIGRLPFSSDFLYTKNNNSVPKKTASFTSFDKTYSINFHQELWLKVDKHFIRNLVFTVQKKHNYTDIAKEDYLQLIDKTRQKIKDNSWQKVVISRTKTISINHSPVDYFLKLCEKFPQAFCYLLYENSENCWIGATPEILAKIQGDQLKTMALAGTLPNSDSEKWTQKEYTEHQLVIEDIQNKLQPFCKEIYVEKTHEWNLNQLKHLKTDISAILKPNKTQDQIVASLHPTSAVCGMPLAETQQFIVEQEFHQREFYTGYIEINTESINHVFVNLRCAKIYQNCMTIYVGGGITADSNSEKEWQETELKSLSIQVL